MMETPMDMTSPDLKHVKTVLETVLLTSAEPLPPADR